jgi:acid phosphatase class B
MKSVIESIKNLFKKWYSIFRNFCYLFAVWAVIYSTISICNFSVAFEYDDGVVYSGDLYRKAARNNTENFYSFINSNTDSEKTKLIPFMLILFFKITGFKVDFIADRDNINTSDIFKKWNNWASSIYFVSDQNQKYELLESKKYLLFFSSSDEGIIQSKKAGIYPLRIKRNPKSASELSYVPGRFNEFIIPFSEF